MNQALLQLNIGMLYNIFVCFLLGIICFIVAKRVSPKYSTVEGKSTFYNKYLSNFWTFGGIMWLLQTVRSYFAWNGNTTNDQYIFYAIIVFLSFQVLFLFLYAFSILFHKYTFSPFLTFLAAILSFGWLLLTLISGIEAGEITLWSSSFTLSIMAEYLFTVAIFFPLLFILGVSFIRELIYIAFDKTDIFVSKHLYTLSALILYLLVIYPDFLGITTGWYLVLMRVMLLIPCFLIYFGFSQVEGIQQKLHEEKIPFIKRIISRRPLIVKTIFLIFISTIIPTALASGLIYYSFTYILKMHGVSEVMLLTEYFQNQILLAVLIIGLLTLFMSMSWVRTLSSRIKTLYHGTREVTNENFEYYIDEEGTKDEITFIGHLFNKVSTYLQDYQATVKDYSQTLEQQVKERTNELDKKTNQIKKLADEHQGLLNQLKARTDIIIDNMGDGLLIINAENIIIKTNKLLLDRFNISESDILNKPVNKVDVFSEYPEILQMVEKLRTKKLSLYDDEIELKKPLFGKFKCRLSPIDLENGTKGTIIIMHEASPPWGTVLNSQTMEPIKLVLVRLINEETNMVIDTEVTDPQGRFGFFVTPGSYSLQAMKEGFHFPPKNPEGYHGEVINIKSRDEGAIKFNILMDPIEEKEEIFDFGDEKKEDMSSNTSTEGLTKEDGGKPKESSQRQDDSGELKTVQELQNKEK